MNSLRDPSSSSLREALIPSPAPANVLSKRSTARGNTNKKPGLNVISAKVQKQKASLSKSHRTQAQRRDESERLLVEATLSVVADQGVSAATFEAIGSKAGFSRGLATQHFGSKRGLIETVIAHLQRKREAAFESEQAVLATAFDAVIHYIKSHLQVQGLEIDGRAYFMLLASTVADATVHRELFAASHQRVREQLYRLLKLSKKHGEIRSNVDCDATALIIGSLLLGASIQKLADPSTDLAPIARTTVKILTDALTAQPGKKKAPAFNKT